MDLDREPLKTSGNWLKVDDRKAELPIRIRDVARLPLAHREILDAKKDPPVHSGPRVRAKAVCVALKNADAFGFDKPFGGIAAMHRNLVPVADIEATDKNEIIGELACQ